MMYLLAVLLAMAIVVVSLLYHKARKLEKELRSLRVKRGMNLEQLIPLSEEYPYDPRGFRFLGNPIDGIQFNDDSIVLVEFKSGKSNLSGKQERIKRLVENGKVYFRVFRVE